ncbi:MAG: hypothetical protein KAX69_07810 [Chitinophagales bacterium]|nr:hypothetical protein [Chitinophagales bacterium]
MNNLQFTMYDVRCTILRFIILFAFIFPSVSVFAQHSSVDSADILRRIAFQDSIFNNLIKVQPYKSVTKKKKEPVTINKSAETITVPVDSQKVVSNEVLKVTDSLSGKSVLVENLDKNKNKKQKKIDTTHYSPKKAAIWGAAFPGLGQVYNKKYWKLPIVYGVLGTVMYFVASNGKKLREFNGYIRNVYDSVPNPAPYNTIELDQIESFRNTYRRNVQIASFGTVFAWGLSIVDAVVDAHLRPFDISDKLTLRIKPEINYSNLTYYTGIGLNLNFK